MIIKSRLPLLLLAIAAAALAEEPNPDPAIDRARDQDPQIVVAKTVVEWPDMLPRLWKQALQHPEADIQREAADTVARALQLGMPLTPRLSEELITALQGVLEQPDQQVVAKVAAARALVQLDARQSAELLARHAAQGPLQLAQMIEPALARWDYQPQREIWLQRLAQGSRPTLLQLAAQGVAAVRDERATADLLRVAMNGRQAAAVRLDAARALAAIQRSGLEEHAADLADNAGPASRIDHLVATQLLAHHSGNATLMLVESLAEDTEPAVAAAAMEHMLKIAPERLIARAEKSLAHRDARVRYLALQGLATQPSSASIARIAPKLDDPIVENRVLARRTLLKWAAEPTLRDAVVEQTSAVLETDAWRGDEQAILILTDLDQKQAAPRFLKLLDHARPEVFVTAAWGLRRLAVAELLEPMLNAARRIADRIKENGMAPSDGASQLAQLLEAMGQMRHQPAESLLREFVPKGQAEEARAAAVWSLGLLLEGKADPQLAKQLEERLQDTASIPPDTPPVRAMCAITLGRLKSESSLPVLRHWYELDTHNNYIGRCCGWAIERISGEKLPDAEVFHIQPGNWFLEAVENKAKD